jgi:hypothetical protein
MRKLLSVLVLTYGFAPAQTSDTAISGRWIAIADFYGTPINFRLELNQQGDKLTGEFAGDKLEGTLQGGAVHFVAKDERGGREECQARIEHGTMSGTFVFTDADDAAHPSTHSFKATAVPKRRSGAPQRHEFTPATFHRQFSATNKPVLTVSPGDTIHTTTVDAGGVDEKGVFRQHREQFTPPLSPSWVYFVGQGQRGQVTDRPRDHEAVAVQVSVALAGRSQYARDVTGDRRLFCQHRNRSRFLGSHRENSSLAVRHPCRSERERLVPALDWSRS